jgi:hypothetical protein
VHHNNTGANNSIEAKLAKGTSMQDIIDTDRKKRFMLGYTKALQGLVRSASSGSQVLVDKSVESVNWHHDRAVEYGVDATLCSKVTSAA